LRRAMDKTTLHKTSLLIQSYRYRRIIVFFSALIMHVIWWDLLISRVPILGYSAQSTRAARHQRLARRFRLLAIEMGGVLIKLGQFLSSRVDVLPKEITDELKGLQDEVPAVPWSDIDRIIHEELGIPAQYFAHVETEPVAAASLGQAHRAWLLPDNDNDRFGAPVVVKVQRPNIEQMVSTDLAALAVVARILMRYPPIRRRADAPALMDEFAGTLWEELDYESEAANAERLARIHAGNKRIKIPTVHRAISTKRVLVLENVETLKMADVAALINHGINPKEVADVLLDAYFKQVFEEGFFHADPHPGNLFVKPEEPWNGQPGNRPFKIVFVDFGMVGEIPSLMGNNLRKIMISIMQRDSRQLVETYQDLGFLLPGADLERIVEAQTTVLNHMWGKKLLEISRPDPKEVQELTSEFRDLLFDMPFQIPQDFIYLGRAFGMVTGLVSQLDPDINPWHTVEKYGQELLRSRRQEQFSDLSTEMLLEGIRPYLELPPRILRLLEMAENGRLVVQSRPDSISQRQQEKINRRLNFLSWSILGSASMISATLWYFLRHQNREHNENSS
jgi:predicted unusual protein kinase regulating ubiquinone biosynthesis (AarF/ABC1/UbiB family)